MNRKKVKLSLFCVVLLFFGSSVAAFGDWDPCDPYKMHFPQLPDPNGWDVAFCWAGPTEERMELADDWLCTRTGPVSDIHFWISWKGDLVGTIESVMVCIYSNDPNGPYGFSEPNELLWSRYFPDGAYTIRQYGSGRQGWYDPNTHTWNTPDHNNYYQINITDINDPFIQEEGEIYWLGIHIYATPFPTYRIGWKTAIRPHFMDDAVWRMLSGGPWMELRDPNTYESLDLSFVITSKEEEPKCEPVTKYVQYPDLNETGMDVDATYDTSGTPWWSPQLLADDFPCVTTGPITDIHIWGSWYHNYLPYGGPNDVNFTLSIHADIPAGPNYSKPGTILWQREFRPGDFNATIEANGLRDGYYVPCAGYYEPNADWTCWRYDFYIDPCDAFIQQGDPCNPVIYWLDVQARTFSEPNWIRFGWKTSLNHWNDDAVWAVGSDVNHGSWNKMRYPSGHPYYPNSVDMAFAITTGAEPNYTKPLEPHTKWSQPPVEIDPCSTVPAYCGWDEQSFRARNSTVTFPCWDIPRQCHGDADGLKEGGKAGYYVGSNDLAILNVAMGGVYPNPPYNHCADFSRDFVVDAVDQNILNTWWQVKEPPYGPGVPPDCPLEGSFIWNLVADDYRCIGSMPVTSIHWWGSFYGWEWPVKKGQLPPVLPEKWWIGFWSNVPAGAPPRYLPYSYPEVLLHSITIPAERVDFNEVGYDAYYSRPNDICYQYRVDLNSAEVFWQDDFNEVTHDNTYWISIVAEYNDACQPSYKWGWKTRPWSWMDDAVRFSLPFEPDLGFVLNPYLVTPIKDPWGESVDMAFELDTDPNYIKWEQLYTGFRHCHWMQYEDVNSTYNFYEPEKERLVADDWRCVRRTPVTAIVWWGSYISYGYEACSSGPFMPLPVPPDKFRLKIWTDVPAGGGGKADVLFLTDTTGSMGGYIDNLKTAFGGILTAIGASLPGVDIEYGVADYKNYTDGGNYQTYGVNLIQPFTSNTGAVQAAINGLSASGGEDWPESQLKGMVTISNNWLTPTTDPNVGFGGRADAQKILIWAGDAHGHIAGDEPGSSGNPPPGYYPTLDGTINALTAQGLIVFALNIEDYNNGLNLPYGGSFNQTPLRQQASEITSATGGTLFCSVGSGGPSIEDAIVASITGGIGYSHPGEVIWEYETSEYDEVLVGYDKHPHGEPNEPVFRYSVKLPDPNRFCQTDINEVFWLSVQAVYDINMPNYVWGWTNHKHVFNDDAVSGYYDYVNETWVWDELYDQRGVSEDMSFMLFTDPNECCSCANYNHDWIINFLDYADFADDWLWVGQPGGYNKSDLNCDGIVNFIDLKIFVLQWLGYCP